MSLRQPEPAAAADGRTDEAVKSRGSHMASTIRPDTVFRLRRIPEKYGWKEVPDLLRRALNQDGDFPVQVGSLARSPYRNDELIATVTLPGARNVLLQLPTLVENEHEWQLDVDVDEDETFSLRLDMHFYGFTPLHGIQEVEYTSGIIAVSGLNGHAYGSFKQRGGPFMWLRDGLPKDLPNTQVFVYGYDTQLHGSSSVQNLTDLGLGLRTALKDVLVAETGDQPCKPVLLIGHSLGGLVIKEVSVLHSYT
ncbi:hypothetical protein SLS54_010252 [Diplodia seriata]